MTFPAADGSTVQRLLLRLWRLSRRNEHTEVFWRLMLGGLPLASRMPPAPVPAVAAAVATTLTAAPLLGVPSGSGVLDSLSTELGGRSLCRPQQALPNS